MRAHWKYLNFLGLFLGIGLMALSIIRIKEGYRVDFVGPFVLIFFIVLFIIGLWATLESIKNIRKK